MDNKRKAVLTVNIMIVVLTLIGSYLCFFTKTKGLLAVYGIDNLKFFTVESNILEGIVSLILLICIIRKKESTPVWLLKYIAAVAVGLTFLTIAAFLGPIYGHSNMYHGSNLFFHLIIPLIAMAEFIFLNDHKMGVKENLCAMIPALLYGNGYLANILINGREDNDWYAFTAWGLPVGIGIFAGILGASYLIGAVLRKCNRAAG